MRVQIENELRIKSELENQRYQEERSRKTQELINKLNEQKSSHLRLQKQILAEQFQSIKSQFRQITNELILLGKERLRRSEIIADFGQLVNDFNQLCDAKMFNAKFNVFYWLLQNQPDFGQLLFGAGFPYPDSPKVL